MNLLGNVGEVVDGVPLANSAFLATSAHLS